MKTSLEVLIAYDHVAAGKYAKELCDRLQQRLGRDYELRLNPWNVAALQIPGLAQAIIHETSRADLLIVAVNGDDTLPPLVQSWISRCLRATRATGGAIVAQFHDILRMGKELAPAYHELKRIALEVHGGFFSAVVEPAKSELDDRIHEIHKRACMRTRALEALPEVG
ncbi:MAG: hypothetical protein ABSH48_02435 [Verrucomicrobiota bacterium]|jgi:hypothetical protein